MKKIFALMLVLVMLLSFAACEKEFDSDDRERRYKDIEENNERGETTEGTYPVESTTPTEPSTTTTTEAIIETTAPKNDDSSYLLNVYHLFLPIYKYPRMDEGQVGSVYKVGVYTIVDEQRDSNGNRWGKLKSGAGWINLDEAQNVPIAAVTMDYGGLKNSCKVVDQCYIDGNIKAYVGVINGAKNLSIVQFDSCWEKPYISKTYKTVGDLKDGEVVELTIAFYGDVQNSNVGVVFTDDYGFEQWLFISQSGLDSSLYMTVITP